MDQTTDIKVLHDQFQQKIVKTTDSHDQEIMNVFAQFETLITCDEPWLNECQKIKLFNVLRDVVCKFFKLTSKDTPVATKLRAISWAKKRVKADEIGGLGWVKALTEIEFSPEDKMPTPEELQAKRLELLAIQKEEVYRMLED